MNLLTNQLNVHLKSLYTYVYVHRYDRFTRSVAIMTWLLSYLNNVDSLNVGTGTIHRNPAYLDPESSEKLLSNRQQTFPAALVQADPDIRNYKTLEMIVF